MHYDVIVVGGGMVGLSAALALVKAMPSLQVCVLEAREAPTPSQPAASLSSSSSPSDARCTAIAPSSMAIFSEIGVWSSLKEHMTAISQVHVSDRGHLGTTSYSQQENAGNILGAVVHNDWLLACLSSALQAHPGITLLAPANADSVRLHADGVSLDVVLAEKSKTLSAELIVAADGANSGLRKKMGIAASEHDYQQSAIITSVTYEQAHGGRAFERFTSNGPLALLPLGESAEARCSALVWTMPQAQADQTIACDEQEFLRRLQKAFGFRLGHFVLVGERYHYPLKRVLANEQVRRSVVLLGNAAHYLHPVAGQGFNLALRDCQRLSSVLAEQRRRGRSLGELAGLQRYVSEQKNDQWLTVHGSHAFNEVFTSDRQSRQCMRNVALLSLAMLKPAKHSFFQQMMGRSFL